MKQKSSSQKTAQRNPQDVDQAPSAGSNGLAIAPPAYGIGSVDHEVSESQASRGAVTQRLADAADTGADAGARSENKTGLPDNLKAGIESLSGLALDDVRVHYNSSRPAQLQALAYTQGTEIHVAPGQERHLPHEAWHVVQQAQGRVKPTMQMKGGIQVNDDEGLEHEADVMGARAVSVPHAPARVALSDVRRAGPFNGVTQLNDDKKKVVQEEVTNKNEYIENIAERFPDLKDGSLGMGKEYINDLKRIQWLMLNEQEVGSRLKVLNDQIGPVGESEREKKAARQRFQKLLKAKEEKHGFETGVLPVGILEPDIFLKLPALGYMMKDPGAGVAHGESTHRLQWYALMTDFEDNPEEWAHTPFELYTKIGERDLKYHQRQNLAFVGRSFVGTSNDQRQSSGKPTLWADLMDQNSSKVVGGFRNPDSAMSWLLGRNVANEVESGNPQKGEPNAANQDDIAHDKLDLPNLRAVLDSRYKKRLNELVSAREGIDYWNQIERDFEKGIELESLTTSRGPGRSTERVGAPQMGRKPAFTQAMEKADLDYRSRKESSAKYEKFSQKKGFDEVLIKKGVLRMTKEEVEKRRERLRQEHIQFLEFLDWQEFLNWRKERREQRHQKYKSLNLKAEGLGK